LIAFTDGKSVAACEPAQDYKRISDGDKGPNTGGMGSYSPVPACPGDLAERIVEEVVRPMVEATNETGAPFQGALYAGLALTGRGPRVIEFNARFGDPETQALMPRVDFDLAEVCHAAATGGLEGTSLSWKPDACVSVVLAARGYPGTPEKDKVITGLDEAAALPGVEIFHAGTRSTPGGIVTAGGRVLAVSAVGEDFKEARARAYAAADTIGFDGKQMRTDIARRAEEAM
jgi:phosphoribosylamine--glycine ligase